MGLRSRKVRLDEIGRGVKSGEESNVIALNLSELLIDMFISRVWRKRKSGSNARANVCSTHVQRLGFAIRYENLLQDFRYLFKKFDVLIFTIQCRSNGKSKGSPKPF